MHASSLGQGCQRHVLPRHWLPKTGFSSITETRICISKGFNLWPAWKRMGYLRVLKRGFTITNSVQQSPWETNSRAASQEIPHFMEHEGSLPHLHKPTHHLLSIRARSIQPAPYHPISLWNTWILSFHLSLGLPSSLLRVSPSNPLLFLFSPYVLHDSPILSTTWSR